MSIEYQNIPADEGQDISAGGIIDQKNYADSDEVVRRARQDILSQLDQIRTDRQELSERFLRLHKLWQAKHHVRLYEGRSDIFVPRAQKVVETHVANIAASSFPVNEVYTLDPVDAIAQQLVMPTKMVMDHLIEQARIRSVLPLLARAGLMLGTAVVKSPWIVRETKQYKRVPTLQEQTSLIGLPEGVPSTFVESKIKQFEGPGFKVVDLLRWHIFPATVQNLEDYQIIMEDMDVDRSFLKTMAAKKAYSKAVVNKVLQRSPKGEPSPTDETLSLRDQRLDAYGLHVGHDGQHTNRYELMEVWCKFDLYNKGDLIPCKMTVVKSNKTLDILEIRQNPFFHQLPPYLAWRVKDNVDNFYGQGVLETLEALQYALNAFMNQAIDSANFQMNQMMIVDIMRLAMNPKNLKFAPLGIIPVRGNPREIITFQSAPDTASLGMQLVSLIAGMMEDEGNAQPITQGKVGRKVGSATEAAILSEAANSIQKAATIKLEEEILTPLLSMWYKLTEQFISADAYLEITGQDKAEVPIQTLVGDYKFRWATAVGSQDRFQAEQLMQVLQQQLGAQAAQGGPAATGQQGGLTNAQGQGQGQGLDLATLLGGGQ